MRTRLRRSGRPRPRSRRPTSRSSTRVRESSSATTASRGLCGLGTCPFSSSLSSQAHHLARGPKGEVPVGHAQALVFIPTARISHASSDDAVTTARQHHSCITVVRGVLGLASPIAKLSRCSIFANLIAIGAPSIFCARHRVPSCALTCHRVP